MLLIGTSVLGAAVLASAFAGGAAALLAIRAVEGMGYLGLVVAAPTLMAREAAARDVPTALALWGTFFTLGLSLAALAGGSLSEAIGWRAWYGANATLLAATLVTAWRLLPRDEVAWGPEEVVGAPLSVPTSFSPEVPIEPSPV